MLIVISFKNFLIFFSRRNILETTKAYLMNTMRMPAAQTMLLFAQSIDTNLTFSRIICDAWICVDFPFVESGQTLLARAANLRDRWNTLLLQKLKSINNYCYKN